MMTLRPASNSFLRLPAVADLLCAATWPGQAEAWAATVRLHVEQHQYPPEEIEMRLYEAAYTLWRLVLDEGLQLYRLDPATFRYVKADPVYFRKAAHKLAESARHRGAFGCAAWLEAERPFDLKFFRQVRWEEALTGLEIEALNYPAKLYARSEDVLDLLVPVPSPDEVLALLQLLRPPMTGHADEEAPRQPAKVGRTTTRKYIYDRALHLLKSNPQLDEASLIRQLKQHHVHRRKKRLFWTRPDGGGEASVSVTAFGRNVRKIRAKLADPRN